MAIDAVAKKLGSIAGVANCAIELVHPVRKTGGQEVTVEDGRRRQRTRQRHPIVARPKPNVEG